MAGEGFVYLPAEAVVRTWCAAMGWRTSVLGGEHLPATGPAVIAANHVSHLDAFLLAKAVLDVGRRRLHFLAKRELFTNPLLRPILRSAHQIEVDRGGDPSRALEPAVQVLRDGGLVAVFPEGTISTSFVPAAPRLGAARMALMADAPLIPATLWGGQRIVTKDRRHWWQRGVLLVTRFAAPLRPLAGEDPRHLTARLWDTVGGLVDEVSRSYPQGPRGPDDRWWLPAHLGGTAPSVADSLRRVQREAEQRRTRRSADLARGR